MINPIHDQAYQEYTRVSHQKPIDTQEKFSMDAAMHENASSDAAANGVIYEPGKSSESDSAQNAATKAKNTASHTRPASTVTERTTHTSMEQPTASANSTSITDTVKHFLHGMLKTIKKVLSAIWESKPAEITPAGTDMESKASVSSDADSTQIPDITNVNDISAKEPSEDDIKKALKAGDADSFRALLSQDGKRIPARSSSLLTYYDATGKLVNIDPSEQHRILHGDRGSQRS